MYKRTVTLQMEVPTELAEVLAEHGDDLLAVLQCVIAETKRVDLRAKLSRAKQERAEKRAKHLVRLKRIGRQAFRLYRKRLADIPKKIKGAERTERRKQLVREVARELNEDFFLVNIAMSRHRAAVEERAKRLRRFIVLRLTVIGWSNDEIGERFGVHADTVSRILGDIRKEAASRGISIFDLERELSAGRGQ